MKKTIKPSISIITPSFNQGKFIEQTIQSVLNQNYPNLEYIVVDGGSTDNTLNILKKYSKHIKWVSEKDKGQSDAINKGFHMSKGDIVAWLNSDDYYENNTLDIISNYFIHNPDIKWLTGDYKIVDQDGKEIQKYITLYKRFLRQLPIKNLLLVTNYVVQPSTFWRREVINNIGELDLTKRYVMDYDYWLRIMQYFNLYKVPELLSNFRIHTQSKGGSEFINQFDEEIELLKTMKISKIYSIPHFLHNLAIKFVYKIIK